MKRLACAGCGTIIFRQSRRAKYCLDCVKGNRLWRVRLLRESNPDAVRRNNENQRDRYYNRGGKERQAEYARRPEVRQKLFEYMRRPEVRERQKEWRDSHPEVVARHKQNQRMKLKTDHAYRDEVNRRARERYWSNIEARREYQKAYRAAHKESEAQRKYAHRRRQDALAHFAADMLSLVKKCKASNE